MMLEKIQTLSLLHLAQFSFNFIYVAIKIHRLAFRKIVNCPTESSASYTALQPRCICTYLFIAIM